MQIIDSTLDALSKYGKRALTLGVGSQKASLSEHLRNTQITPVCFIENTLTADAILKDLLLSQLDAFALMYLSVFNKFMGNMITNCATEGILDSLATDRDLDTQLVAILQAARSSLLDYNLSDLASGITPTLQAKIDRPANTGTSGEVRNDLKDAPMLAVGRELKLTWDLGSAGKSTANVTVRLATNIVTTRLITSMVEANVADVDFITRAKMKGYGEITWWELFTLADIIDRQQRVAVMDKSDIFGEKFRRGSSDAAYFFSRGELPINRASGIMIITSETANALASTLGNKLSDSATRERFFKGTAGMILTIVDRHNEVITTYYRGLRHPQELTFRDAKKSKKSDDLTDVLKVLTDNNTPKTFY